jgi:hypothetical protein
VWRGACDYRGSVACGDSSMAGLAVGLHIEHHSGTGDPPGKENMMGAHRRRRAVVRWWRRRRRVVAAGGSGDFLEQEGEVGGERAFNLERGSRGGAHRGWGE